MSAAHTPGPWSTHDGYGPAEGGTAVGAGDGWLVCSCTGYYGRNGAQANARLIAAAPELLEALEICAETLAVFVESGSAAHGSVIDKNLVRARVAIAKATGATA